VAKRGRRRRRRSRDRPNLTDPAWPGYTPGMLRRNFLRAAFGCSLLPAAATTQRSLPRWNYSASTIEEHTYNCAFVEKLRWEAKFPKIIWVSEETIIHSHNFRRTDVFENCTYAPIVPCMDDPEGVYRARVVIVKKGSRGEQMWILTADGEPIRSSVCLGSWRADRIPSPAEITDSGAPEMARARKEWLENTLSKWLNHAK